MQNFAFLNTWPSSYESLERRHDFENDFTQDRSDCKKKKF